MAIGSGDGRLYMLDPGRDERPWGFDTIAPLLASPAIAGGKLVVGSQDGKPYCFGRAVAGPDEFRTAPRQPRLWGGVS